MTQDSRLREVVAGLRGGDIRDQCRKAAVAFHLKPWGGVFKKRNGRLLKGRTWDEMPAIPAELLASRPAPGRAQLLLE